MTAARYRIAGARLLTAVRYAGCDHPKREQANEPRTLCQVLHQHQHAMLQLQVLVPIDRAASAPLPSLYFGPSPTGSSGRATTQASHHVKLETTSQKSCPNQTSKTRALQVRSPVVGSAALGSGARLSLAAASSKTNAGGRVVTLAPLC